MVWSRGGFRHGPWGDTELCYDLGHGRRQAYGKGEGGKPWSGAGAASGTVRGGVQNFVMIWSPHCQTRLGKGAEASQDLEQRRCQ